jgi:23S rRNA (uracil1939-C5)-methyltransferase
MDFMSKKNIANFKNDFTKIKGVVLELNSACDGILLNVETNKVERVRIPFCKPKDEVEIIEINNDKNNPVAIKYNINKSNHNIPLCEYFYSCGGCKLQHLFEDEYKHFKKDIFVKSMEKNLIDFDKNKIEYTFLNVLDIDNKRRRLSLFFKDNKLGFKKYSTNEIVDIKKCVVANTAINSVIEDLKKALESLNLSSEIKISITSIDDFLDIVIDNLNKINLKEIKILQKLMELDTVNSIFIMKNNSIEPFAIKKKLSIKNNGNVIKISPQTFLQPSFGGEKILQNIVYNHLEKSEMIADFFCGNGTFSFMFPNTKIYGFEINKESVDAINNIDKNVTAFEKNLFEKNLTLSPLNGKKFNVIINPPRLGALNLCKKLVKLDIEKIVYVSCNFVSMFNDIKIFLESSNYKITKINVVDQFIFSQHIETIVLIEKIT